MDKPIKDWVLKVQEQVDLEMDTRRKMASDIHELIIVLENVIETLTQGDPRWAKIACIRDAQYMLKKVRGY
jgi:hypothetical protein